MIYLKRNNKQDGSFTAPNNTTYFKPGFIYKLVEVVRFSHVMPIVKLKTKGVSGCWMELNGSLGCFDYVKQVKQ